MKSLTVMLTAALVLCLAASAGAHTDVRSPDSVTPIEPATPASQDLRSPDSVTPTQNTVAAPAASSDVTLSAAAVSARS